MTRVAIVCIDDEEVILSSLGEQLKRSFGKDYDIELAASGKEALLLCAEIVAEGIEIPLIISDQIMPGMQGDELLVQLHSLYPKTLKILLTGQATADSVGRIVNAAALYRYITKPWNEIDLILTVKEALRRYNQEQELTEINENLIKINAKLKSSLSLLLATFEATADGILVLDNLGKTISCNQKFIDLWGIPTSTMAGQDDEQMLTVALEQLVEPSTFSFKHLHAQFNPDADLLKLKNGKIVESYLQPQRLEGEIVGQVWSFRDVTERQRAEAAVKYQAFHDALTGLPNRVFYDRQLAVALANAQQAQSMLAVMFLDLDRFKVVNDTLGHAIGDLLLQGVVERMTDCIRQGDSIARWGGDEFTLLLPEISCREDATAIAMRILETFKPAFLLQGHSLYVTSSIGIAVYPHDGQDADTLLKNADTALYRSKQRGRNDYQHYTLTINSQHLEITS
jgi:diguanylate cyclase (GGDEF)-like protein/PAS domain S-box-containing protein